MATKEVREACRRAREEFVKKNYWRIREVKRLWSTNFCYQKLLNEAREAGCCGKTVCDVDLSISLDNEFNKQQEVKRGQRKG